MHNNIDLTIDYTYVRLLFCFRVLNLDQFIYLSFRFNIFIFSLFCFLYFVFSIYFPKCESVNVYVNEWVIWILTLNAELIMANQSMAVELLALVKVLQL